MPSEPLKIVRTVKELRQQVSEWKQQGLKVGLVPTMGALHHGHISLVKQLQKDCDRMVVSIFVNPKQFGPSEDLDKYPRQEKLDAEKLTEAGVELLYAPTVEEMYPEGFLTTVSIAGMTEVLCGASRPGHFDGVTTVVTKLLLQCLPDMAIFGEKDFQQLAVLKKLVRDLDIPVQVVSGKLIRDEDGLATSSRNVYLSPEQRTIALEINRTLKKIVDDLEAGRTSVADATAQGKQHLLEVGFNEVQYLEVRDAKTLQLVAEITKPARVLVAAILGATRLIDNMAIEPK
ncbi:pantoate--beta-alanine ligase [Emcibacter nanhaiensis]|uniref:Pantothenate synthetase n=1 Tax=Emcibacter nanhaiensis TaxID=1505037 RepID=A0A501PSW0_9PROT|nr:pantoate--beta-alanine ligase [Emcibacter nanhaiensis]TPD63187.1 pantoate--beta-alanine ligase [Emcibacter nanhaiensis]